MPAVRVGGMPAEKGRWLFVGFGLLANVCLGAVYAFSVFRKPLEDLWGIKATESGLPFMVFLATFALGMAFAGGLVERWGPRKTGILGGILVGIGWILSGFSPNVLVLTLLYGVVGGAGVGVAYGCPIAVATKWFPDRKGLAVGLTVMGFGISALVVAPITGALIGSVGVLRTFTCLGIAFLAALVVLALPLRFPPAGWRPAGWAGAAAKAGTVELDRNEMVRTASFYALWATYTIGCLSGLMAIGIAAPFGREVACLSASLSALAVSVFAVFNGAGRPLFGWLTDRLTPRYAALVSFGLILLAAAALWRWGEGSAIVYFIAFSVLWLNLGGWLAIAPTATATFFGTKHYGKNYGLVFTAYGAGAILGNVLSGVLRDATGTYLAVFPPVMALAALGLVVALVGLRPVKACR
ncbi:OFA family MFS transporter [Candidatus Bipolaricaulota bacterium]|nr:OFA family MFS transporter [Candidatus Bipolaricaulota bacterium]